MSEITYEERAVAFIDVLGFSKLVEKSAQNDSERMQLQFLVNLLESTIPVFNQCVRDDVPSHLIPKYIYISDSIILSAPLSDHDKKFYSGLESVVMRTIQLSHRFLEAGYLYFTRP